MNINDYLTPREYVIKNSGKILMFKDDPTSFVDEVKISWRGRNRGKGIEHWAIIKDSWCFTKNGKWEWEPSPSQRDDDFINRCRYDSVEEALETYLKWEKGRTFLAICPNCDIAFNTKKEPKPGMVHVIDELCPKCYTML